MCVLLLSRGLLTHLPQPSPLSVPAAGGIGNMPMVTRFFYFFLGWLPQCWEILSPSSHFKCKTRCSFLPLHYLEPSRGDRPL